MNQFLTIWSKPNDTLRDIIDNKSIGYGLLIMIISALSSSVFIFEGSGILEDLSLPIILLLSVLLTTVFTTIGYFFNGGVYLLLGKMLGGQGRYKQVCLATASAALPMIGLLPVAIMAVILYGQGLYAELADPFALSNMSTGFYLFYIVLTIGLSIYAIVILSKALGYAHGFSALRGFGTTLLYMAIGFVLVFIIGIIAVVGILSLSGL